MKRKKRLFWSWWAFYNRENVEPKWNVKFGSLNLRNHLFSRFNFRCLPVQFLTVREKKAFLFTFQESPRQTREFWNKEEEKNVINILSKNVEQKGSIITVSEFLSFFVFFFFVPPFCNLKSNSGRLHAVSASWTEMRNALRAIKKQFSILERQWR